MTTDEMRLVALTDVAQILGCSVSHVRALVDRGILPAARDTRGRRLFLQPDVVALRDARAKATKKAKPKLDLRSKKLAQE